MMFGVYLDETLQAENFARIETNLHCPYRLDSI